MRYLKAILIVFLLVGTFGTILMSAPLSRVSEIVGYWETKNQAGNDVTFFFGSEDDFFIENETSWIQGTYATPLDADPRQLDLFIQDGSNVEDIGKEVRYRYDIYDNLLTLSGTTDDGTDRPTPLDVENPAGSFVIIGVNTDLPDEDFEDHEDNKDGDWVVYANCFVEVLAGILISP